MTEATATFEVRPDPDGASVVDIQGDVTAASEDVLMGAYEAGRRRAGDRPQLHRPRRT